MRAQLRRTLAMAGVVAFGAVTGALAALGHSPIAIGLIGALVAAVALLALQARSRDRQIARRITELSEPTRGNPGGRGRDQVSERLEELERRLLASLDAERQRAAERHRALMERDSR